MTIPLQMQLALRNSMQCNAAMHAVVQAKRTPVHCAMRRGRPFAWISL
jgi:hypothetical protein